MSETKTLVINMKTGEVVPTGSRIYDDLFLKKRGLKKVEIPENSTDWCYHKYTRVLFYVIEGKIRSINIE